MKSRMAVALGSLGVLLLAANVVLVWNVDAAASAGRPPAATLWLIGLAGAPIVGMIVAGRRPDNAYGWLLLSFSVTSALLELTELYALYALQRFGSAGVAGVTGALVSQTLWGATIGHLPLLLLLFPDGRLPSPRWRWLLRSLVTLTVVGSITAVFIPGELGSVPVRNPIGIGGAAGRIVEGVVIICVMGMFAGMFPAAASLFVRGRHASGQARLQLRWFSWAAAVLAIALIFGAVFGSDYELLVNAAMMLALSGLFGAIGIAVLRYRLYEIDQIISRTVSYLTLTLVLGAVYVAAVTAITTVTAPIALSSPLEVAAATLATAAAFGPARRRIQQRVDRRFNRARYDAARAVEGYRTALRDELELEALRDRLLAIVDTTLQPERAQLWLTRVGAA